MGENVTITVSMRTLPQGVEWVRKQYTTLVEGFKCEVAIYEIGDRTEMVADFGQDASEAARFAAMFYELTGAKPTVRSPGMVN
jgi:hypothetical protein